MLVNSIVTYFGPPLGFYDSVKFSDFIKIDVGRFLQKNGFDPSFNEEEIKLLEDEETRVYQFESGIGVSYTMYPMKKRCKVMIDSLGSEEGLVKMVLNFIAQQDNQKDKWQDL